MSFTKADSVFSRAANTFTAINGGPVSAPPLFKGDQEKMAPVAVADAILELSDGSTYRGIGFGAEGKSVAGECVFQTGMST
jgi:carbamoyl-phosphate synthase/aspartate carbamoyltransferase